MHRAWDHCLSLIDGQSRALGTVVSDGSHAFLFINADRREQGRNILFIMDKATIKAKRVECLIGIFFLIPPVLGVLAFVLQLYGANTDFSQMDNLSYSWTRDGDGGMSAAPVYLGLMALAGAYLIKDSFYSFFHEEDDEDENQN